MLGTDKYAYKSCIKDVNPLQKIGISFFVMIFCILLNNWQVSMITCISMIILNKNYGNHTLSEIGHMFNIPIGFILIGTLTVVIGRYQNVENLIFAFKVGNYFYGVTKYSMSNGFNIITKSLGIISCVYFFMMNTTISDFSVAMKKLKVPQIFTELMELIYRFIFILWETKNRIVIAQNSRLGYKNLITSYYSSSDLIARIFIDTLRRSDKIYNALESRGYQGSFETIREEYQENNEIIAIGIIIIGIQILVFISSRYLWKI